MKTSQAKNERAVLQKLRMHSFTKLLKPFCYLLANIVLMKSLVVLYAPLL